MPFIRHEFCRWPAAHLPIANFLFAVGKVKVCRLQMPRWPTAKFLPDKRQIFSLPSPNNYFLNGKSSAARTAAKPWLTFFLFLFTINSSDKKNIFCQYIMGGIYGIQSAKTA
ncbi:MAG TPA: hypothetical protein IAA30_05920 [Candidatus Treponema faecavium]|nr:hypothetical protein [Candidatus Treponema faecavium]